jgi:hypothetical protein
MHRAEVQHKQHELRCLQSKKHTEYNLVNSRLLGCSGPVIAADCDLDTLQARLPVRRLSGRTLELEKAFLSDTELDGQQSTLCNM